VIAHPQRKRESAMKNRIKNIVWCWTLRRLRGIVWAVDEWIHAHEVRLQCAGDRVQAPDPSVDRQASAAREKTIKRQRTRHSGTIATARLRYQGGQFVRQEGV
jgi:hypothetical protein